MSRFVGQLGKFITAKVRVVKKLHRTSWGYKPNSKTDEITKYLYVLSDPDGNILTITTPSSAFKPGEEWKLVGRVKRHKEFNGVAQTHICRWSMEQSFDHHTS